MRRRSSRRWNRIADLCKHCICACMALSCGVCTVSALPLSADQLARINALFLVTVESALKYNDVKDVSDKFLDAVKVGSQVAGGSAPDVIGSSWGELAGRYRSALAQLEGDAPDLDFDESAFAVSWEQISACHTREESLATLRSYADAFQAALARGVEKGGVYDRLKVEIGNANEAIRRLIDIAGKLSGWDVVALNLIDLQANIAPLAARIQDRIKKNKAAIDRTLERIRNRKSNLDGNVRDISVLECSLAGDWNGTIDIEGNVFSIAMRIQGGPGQYEALLSRSGKPSTKICIIKISPVSKEMIYRPKCSGPSSELLVNLRISDNYRSMQGIQSDEDDASVGYPVVFRR